MDKMLFECESCTNEPIDRINISRFIDKLDSLLKENDLDKAKEHLIYWEKTAREYGDTKGLLAVLNEWLGLSRRINDREKGISTIKEVMDLIKFNDMQDNISSATIYINAATTYKCFGETRKSLPIYEVAEDMYKKKDLTDTFEYATLLNNRSTALVDVGEYETAERDLKKAIKILDKEGHHDVEIALSLISLCHLYFDRDDNAYELVEKTLDEAWEYINSNRQERDANYAYTISKLIPSFRYFKREMEANALEEVVKEIYGD